MKAEKFEMHFLYWILPTIALLTLIFIFYFDPLGLSKYIAPESNREFGLVENIQLLLLILIFIYCIKGIQNHFAKVVKFVFGIVAAATLFMILEETDYGLHFYDYIAGKSKEDDTHIMVFNEEVRNFHNYGNVNLNILKLLSYLLIVIMFVIVPLLPESIKRKNGLLNYLSPTRFIISTALSLLILNQVALYINRNFVYSNRSLDHNVSEFEEIMTYYIILLYVREIVGKGVGKVEVVDRVDRVDKVPKGI